MSQILINAYLAEVARLKHYSGAQTEQVIREAFKDLLKAWAKARDLHFVAEWAIETSLKTTVRPDGTILHDIRIPLGHWEAKDTDDDLDEEIAKKFKKGYPQDNIIFENSETAVLIQNRKEIIRCAMTDTAALARLLDLFFRYERPEIALFRRAVEQFQADLPAILQALRGRIDAAYAGTLAFRIIADTFLAHARETINPTFSEADVREMLIQHILTEEIFASVFNDAQYHRENNIAKELMRLEDAFFTGAVKRDTLKVMQPYYAAIRANAAQITGHGEKQAFLKVIYENFYKVYNPKAADRLGVVYTPNEIVRFMIEGADWLCRTHFNKSLIDDHVEILDPATGTGTFICELLDMFRGQPEKLRRKYKSELHANEVAILPYYVANLNIEATYAAISGQYEEFENLCFVDTLDNVGGLGIKSGHQHDLFAALSDENVARVVRQNKSKISVVIGNPPYNANQKNENDKNKNRAYPRIDDLIKRSFVKLSTAQKTKVYDMYARFFRWAFDRVHDDGIVAFVTNRSFIDSRTFDGFRKYMGETFAEAWIVDLGGDVRANPRLSGTKHNVFGIQTGVAISFLVKRKGKKGCIIRYARRPELETAEDKLGWLGSTKLWDVRFETITPDAKVNWVNLTENGWEGLIPVANKRTKAATVKGQERAMFKLYSLGVSTNRDEWVYDFSKDNLMAKMGYFANTYHEALDARQSLDTNIKLSRNLSRRFSARRRDVFAEGKIKEGLYRPFTRKYFYFSDLFIDEVGSYPEINVASLRNETICFTCGGRLDFFTFVSDGLPNLTVLSLDANQCLPRYRFTPTGERVDNITDWALNRFRDRYGKSVTKDAIFAYTYAVLHDPLWRATYAINLKREFPRVPFHTDFTLWSAWGRRLLDLHIGYETAEPWPLVRTDLSDKAARAAGQSPKPILKSDLSTGTIILDSETTLTSLPPAAWAYRLGNRSAVDWILDQHKERRPRDPTIRAKFDTYRFRDHKEKVADLVARVARVAVETMEIVEAMRAIARTEPVEAEKAVAT
jgi:predicted helicase